MNDFERESSTMDMKEEMMSDAVDDAMEGEDEGEGEEVEGDKILKEVLDEIGMSMNESVNPLSLSYLPPISVLFSSCGDHVLIDGDSWYRHPLRTRSGMKPYSRHESLWQRGYRVRRCNLRRADHRGGEGRHRRRKRICRNGWTRSDGIE
jgi:hypothetical protein